ncbi:protein tyrosine phosphatase [Ewingella americana]|uniref:protein-tyrosine-phosphatase n=1 Tax=Ewingella americana TaxID=41202 RepID=A0A377NA89_9GAMM|nr:protein tyrosine phosphatase [Ewingella americana]STQ43007.1 Low molecular weight protein-tyrosine-phosphatase wzb [Ewingella americana]
MGGKLEKLNLNTILVVCVGNVCRSPIGERLLQTYLPDYAISSAGLNALSGHNVDPSMAESAIKHGITLKAHSARQLTQELCREHDLILVMEKKHICQLSHIAPAAQGKTFLFGHWSEQLEIHDPFHREQGFHDQVVLQLQNCTQQWRNALKKIEK